MRNTLITILIFGLFGQSIAQSDSLRLSKAETQIELTIQNIRTLQTEITQLKTGNKRINRGIANLKNFDVSLEMKIDSLLSLLNRQEQSIVELNSLIDSQNNELSGQIKKTEKSATERLDSLNESLTKNTLYWIIAVLTVGVIVLILFLLLRKRVSDNQSSIVENLSSTRNQLEQEGIRLDEKLIGVMETQLKVIQEEKASSRINPSEPDHSLALKVADEIVRIEKNIGQMDEGTKGLKQLAKAVERIRDNFAANGYEMVEMVGKPYDEGMKVTANFRPDEKLEEGERIISRIIKPQVNFKGVMIQSAQIEVSQGE